MTTTTTTKKPASLLVFTEEGDYECDSRKPNGTGYAARVSECGRFAMVRRRHEWQPFEFVDGALVALGDFTTPQRAARLCNERVRSLGKPAEAEAVAQAAAALRSAPKPEGWKFTANAHEVTVAMPRPAGVNRPESYGAELTTTLYQWAAHEPCSEYAGSSDRSPSCGRETKLLHAANVSWSDPEGLAALAGLFAASSAWFETNRGLIEAYWVAWRRRADVRGERLTSAVKAALALAASLSAAAAQ